VSWCSVYRAFQGISGGGGFVFVLTQNRYCSTPKHLMLLLTLLSAQPDAEPGEPHVLAHPPGLVVLWDIAGMFMEEIAADENDVPLAHTGEGEGDTADQGAAAHGIPRAEKGFKQG
jgi:hypothetical protein